jgi:UDP-glucose 4-epimerase
MKIFVSGGAGFIGSHLVERLLLNHEIECVTVLDNLSSGHLWHLGSVASDSRLEIVQADLKDETTVQRAMLGSSLVYHFAANPDIARAVTQPNIDFWEGTYLTQNILEAMRLTGTKRIVYTSGSGIYGQDNIAFKETYGPCRPISTYGASKLACEGLISAYCYMFDLFGRAFRFANVVGPRQTHGVGYDFVRRLKRDPHHLRILGDGRQSKSYIYVDDVLEAMSVASRADGEPFDCYNVATDDYITVKEIADIAVAESGMSVQDVRYEYTGGDRGWKGDVPIVRFDVSKIKSVGWRAGRNSKEAIRDSIRAMLAQLESKSVVSNLADND